MRKITILVFLFINRGVAAQDPVASFTRLSDSLPAEHIYVQCNQDYYVAGETIWFKAYLLSRYNPSTLSANLYVELLNEEHKTVLSGRFPVFTGAATGSIDLPDTLSQGAYVLRAYTTWSLNFGDLYVFKKGLAVFNESKKTVIPQPAAEPANCIFFPQGGELVAGIPANVSYRAFDWYLQPLKVSGKLLDAKGNEVVDFEAGPGGTGLFSFVPQAGEIYTAEVLYPGKSVMKYTLPSPVVSGVLLDVFEREGGKIFTVNGTAEFVHKKLRLLGIVQNTIVANAEVLLNQGVAEGFIDTRKMDPGLMQLLLFDETGRLLSYTNTFINAGNMEIKGTIRTDIVDFSAKGRNVFHLVFPDSVAGNFSMSITDISNGVPETKAGNISEGLLLQAGCRSYLPTVPPEAAKEWVEDLAMTGDWPVNYPYRAPQYKDAAYITVKGKVLKELRRDQQIKDELNIIVQTKDSTTAFFSVPLQANDSFELKNLVYEDSARFFYQLNAKKNADKYLKIELDNTPMIHPVPAAEGLGAWFNSCKMFLADKDIQAKAAAAQKEYEAAKANGNTLAEVVVKAKVLSKEKQLDKKYTSGLFSGGIGAKMIDVGSEAQSSGAMNILQYLQGKIAGATIYFDSRRGHWIIESPRSYSTGDVLAGGNGLVDGLFFVDEIPMDGDFVERIPVSQVAYVKFFPPGSIMYPGVGISCVLAIYTKKGDDMLKLAPTYLNNFSYPGYTVAKPFIMPDYSQELKKVPDFRRTLYWNPELVLDGSSKETRIEFYNSDNARKFRVIVEGFTTKGELVHMEKIIEK